MRSISRLAPSLVAVATMIAACGGATPVPRASSGADAPGDARSAREAASEPASPRPQATAEPPASQDRVACSHPVPTLAAPGGAVMRPVKGSALRFSIVLQGGAYGVRDLRGVDMTLPPSDGPFTVGTNSGHWAELRDASGKVIYTETLRDPTSIEGPGPSGTLVHVAVDPCKPAPLPVDVPNDPRGVALVLFGSDSPGGATRELARFSIR